MGSRKGRGETVTHSWLRTNLTELARVWSSSMMENVDALESSSDPCSMVALAFKKNALFQHILHQDNEPDSEENQESRTSHGSTWLWSREGTRRRRGRSRRRVRRREAASLWGVLERGGRGAVASVFMRRTLEYNISNFLLENSSNDFYQFNCYYKHRQKH